MQTLNEKSQENIRRMKLKSQSKRTGIGSAAIPEHGSSQERLLKQEVIHKLEDDDKPEPHLPKTQERTRVKSAFRNCNLKQLEKERLSDGRSSACLSRHSKLRGSVKVGPNHFMATRQDPPLPQSHLDRTSTTGFVRTGGANGLNNTDKDDIVSVISQARTLLSEGKMNASMNAQNLQAIMTSGMNTLEN